MANDNSNPYTVNGAPPPTQGFLENGALVFSNFTLPANGNSQFTLRITNVRVNAHSLPAGSFLTATVSSSLAIQDATNLVMGVIEPSLDVATSSVPVYTIGQPQSENLSNFTIGELFNSAFKGQTSQANGTAGGWYQPSVNNESQTILSQNGLYTPSGWINQLMAFPGGADCPTRIRVNLYNRIVLTL